MEYETGVRLDALEQAVIEMQHKLFPERFKKKETTLKAE